MTQRRRQNEADPASPDPRDPDPTPDELEAFDEVQRLITETGPGAAVKVIVFRKRSDGKPPDRCRTFSAGELENLDVIPEKLGGGEFILQLMDQENRYVKRLQVSWPIEMYPPPRPAPPASAAASPAPAAAPAPDRFSEMMLMMHESNRRSEERYTQLLTTIVTTMIGSARPPSLKDRVEELASLKGLMSPNPSAPIELIKEAVQTGMNIARGKTGDEDDEGTEWAGLINKGLDVLDKAVTNRGATGPRPVGVPARAGAPGGAQVPDELKPYLWLMKYVPAAIGWAKSGVPVNRAANAVYSLVPEDHLPVLETFARMDGAERGQILVGLDPRLGPYQAYMNELAAQLVQIFDAEGEDDGEDDAGDVPGSAESA